jgi:hypothetical protein
MGRDIDLTLGAIKYLEGLIIARGAEAFCFPPLGV